MRDLKVAYLVASFSIQNSHLNKAKEYIISINYGASGVFCV